MQKIHSFFKEHTTASLVILIFIFFAATSLVSFFKFRSAHYFGKVSSLTPKQIVIVDKKVGAREFLITNKTKIRSGKRVQERLALEQEVMVVAKPIATSSLEALEIRVFEPRK